MKEKYITINHQYRVLFQGNDEWCGNIRATEGCRQVCVSESVLFRLNRNVKEMNVGESTLVLMSNVMANFNTRRDEAKRCYATRHNATQCNAR